jgi:class 3 adenylate cyclase
MVPETRYVKTALGSVAFQVVGDGPVDIVLVPEPPNAIDLMWDNPRIARLPHRLSEFARLICFDAIGHGSSDNPEPFEFRLEQLTDSLRAVLDAAAVRQAVLLGHGGAAFLSALFSATYPERTRGLILFNAFARFARAPDYPFGMPAKGVERILEDLPDRWGTGDLVEANAPSLAADRLMRKEHARYERLTIPPGTQRKVITWLYQLDYRQILGNIHVPTLVLHRAGDRYIRVEHGRYLGRSIPNARYVELPGDDHTWYAGDVDAVAAEVQTFVTGKRGFVDESRVLATVMFVDIVDSTRLVVELGDERWRERLDHFYAEVRGIVARFHGREVDTAGDGYLARFETPTRAVRCAVVIDDSMRELGWRLRVGLHTGECEIMGEKVAGLAVHAGSRIAAAATAGEIWTSSVLKDLAVGSGVQFVERGTHALKGIPEPYPLYAVVKPS